MGCSICSCTGIGGGRSAAMWKASWWERRPCNPGSPGFATVRIEPFLGDLTFAEGQMPHQKGDISVRLEQSATGLKAVVMLPAGLDGDFIWNGQTKQVKGGNVSVMYFR